MWESTAAALKEPWGSTHERHDGTADLPRPALLRAWLLSGSGARVFGVSWIAVSETRHQHFIPKLLLDRFAVDPAAKVPRIFHLDVESGRCYPAATKDTAVVRDLYMVETIPGAERTVVESGFADWEGAVAPLLERLAPGLSLTDDERLELLALAVMLHLRNPRGLEHLRRMEEVGEEFRHEAFMHDPGEFYDAAVDAGLVPLDDRAASESLRTSLLADLGAGRVTIEIAATRQHAIRRMLDLIPRMVNELADLPCTILWRADDAPAFVIGDVPVVMIDPTPAPPSYAAAWKSSPRAETTLPLSKDCCLLFSETRSSHGEEIAPPALVLDINLRTYANAETRIYGESQYLLCEVIRRSARADRRRVAAYRRRPPALTIFHVERGADGTERPLWTETRRF